MSRKITVLVPQGKSRSLRVVRGGCWYDDPVLARVAYRPGITPDYRSSNLGFRIIVEIPCVER